MSGTTALMHAAKQGHSDCVQVLLHNGARCDLRNANGLMAEELAMQNGHDDIAHAIHEFTL